ncbi:hypothetical protein [Limosilactobacillus sp.]|uniref:hypothetical protein n=1 Tax=Limosilactobacillus sp. TaxID=2773925 RepID=UPI003F0ED783
MVIKDINQFLGAWITAGVALGGIIFAAIQAIASAVAKTLSTKSDNETKIQLKEMQLRQETERRNAKKAQEIRSAFSDYCGYTAALLNSKGVEYVSEQATAFGKIVAYTSGTQNVIASIQDYIIKKDYENAMINFQNILKSLKEEETSLLLPLEQHSPKDCKGGSLD